jgi:hypothetical protein
MSKVDFDIDMQVGKITVVVLDKSEEWANVVMEDAVANCPYDKGVLVGTHKVERTETGVKIIAGEGGAEDYAIIQHEDMSLHHQVGEAKWLENAANRHLSELVPSVNAGIGSSL